MEHQEPKSTHLVVELHHALVDGIRAADKKIAVGDAIIAASNDLPYGLTIGTVSSISAETAGGVFQEAVITFSYDAQDIAELAFIIWTSD